MDWFPWYFTLYEQDTMHLSPYQDGCYRRLIDHYMKTRTPPPDNDAALARIVGDSLENWTENASRIVRAFFKPKNGVLLHKFCDKILDEQDLLAKKRSKSAKIAAEKRWQKNNENQEDTNNPDAGRMRDACETQCETPVFYATGQDKTGKDNKLVITSEDNKQTLELINKKTLQKKIFEKPENVSAQVWQDFLAHRKAKKAPVTETVINRFAQEAQKIGWTLEQALVESCAQNWQGFKAEWVKNSQNRGIGGQQNVPATRLTRSQQFDRATDEIFNEIDRGLVGQ